MSSLRCRDNRDTTKTFRKSGIGVRLNCEFENIKPALRTSVQQWILFIVIANIDVGARLNKLSDHLRIMLVGRYHDRGSPLCVSHIDIRAFLEKFQGSLSISTLDC